MSLMLTGLTEGTQRRFLFDAGIVYRNYGIGGQAIIGATRGGNSIEVLQEMRQMMVDGQPGRVKGDTRLVKDGAKLTINICEHTTGLLLDALPGATNTPTGTHDVITRATQIAAGDYITNLAVVIQKAGTAQYFVFKIANALCVSGAKMDFKEKDEAVITLEFEGSYAANALTTAPWEISNPLEGASGFYTFTYTAGLHGSIIGTTPQTVQSGANGSAVYAHADALYEFSEWTDASTDNPRTDLAAAADITQEATFTLIA
jgi:hypothetical protein